MFFKTLLLYLGLRGSNIHATDVSIHFDEGEHKKILNVKYSYFQKQAYVAFDSLRSDDSEEYMQL